MSAYSLEVTKFILNLLGVRKWSHLSNAVHIDRILASFKSHSDQWKLSKNVVSEEKWYAAREKVWNTVSDEVADAVWAVACKLKCKEVWGALICLIAYDDCAYMLDSEVGELKILAAFGDHKAILLLPACVAFHSIKEHENVN